MRTALAARFAAALALGCRVDTATAPAPARPSTRETVTLSSGFLRLCKVGLAGVSGSFTLTIDGLAAVTSATVPVNQCVFVGPLTGIPVVRSTPRARLPALGR